MFYKKLNTPTFFNYKTFSWERFPALYIFFSLISGALLAKGFFFSLLLCLTHKKKSFSMHYIILAFCVCLLFLLDKKINPNEPKKCDVEAYIQPIEAKKKSYRSYVSCYVPYVKTDDGKEYEKLECIIPLKKNDPKNIDSDFIIKGTLKKSSYGFFLHPKSWIKTPFTYSLVKRRSILKEKARRIIQQNIDDPDVSNYLVSLVTGTISDEFIKQRFLSCGLLHTLAISGFHFSWIIFLLSIPLCLLLPKRIALVMLLFLGWCYFLFIGPSSSISRAWVAVSIYLLTILFSSVPLSLNALGASGIISIILNPYCVYTLSFALSYLATFSVICLNGLATGLTNYLSPRRRKITLDNFPFVDRCVYRVLRLFLLSFFLSCLVQITLLPIFFLSFPFFSAWGIFYNVFFPLTMIPTLILLLLAFSMYPFGDFSFLWHLNQIYTKPLLEMVLYGKGAYHLLIKLPSFDHTAIEVLGCAIIFFCLIQEDHSFEQFLDSRDEYMLT